MNDKFNLLGFDWLIGHNFVLTLLLCWLLSPIGMIVVGLIGELRLVPLDPRKQFMGFIPGDLILGIAAALLLTIAWRLPGGQWYTIPTVQWGWLGAAVVVAIIMTAVEIKSKFYPIGAILSPTKLYHNFLLYGGYGFVITFLVVVCGWSLFMGKLDGSALVLYIVAIVVALLWVGCNIVDEFTGFLGQLSQAEKAKLAHVDKWWERWPRFLGFIE